MFARVVRFDLVPGTEEAFDRLVADTAAGVRAEQPRTLLCLRHKVQSQPSARVFYELYRDREALEVRGRQLVHVQRFLVEREPYFRPAAARRVPGPAKRQGLAGRLAWG